MLILLSINGVNMATIPQTAQELLLTFATKASSIFLDYDNTIIQRRKKDGSNIDSKYVCQFTIELLTRQAGGLRGTADRLAETLEVDATLTYAASSICEARKKFSSKLFLDLNQALLDELSFQTNFWQGRRLFAVDGSKIVLPKLLEKSGFKPEKKESHYPMGLLSCLYEVETQLIHDISLNNHGNERKAAIAHFHKLSADDIVIYDRGYFAFNLLAAHRQNKHDFVMRFSEKTGVKELEEFIRENADQESAQSTVRISPASAQSKKKLAKDFPSEDKEFLVRLIKYVYDGKPYYLITSLLNMKIYPKSCFSDLYHSRWGVEEAYKQLKVYLLKKEFHGNCHTTVRQEIYASVLVANMSRTLALFIEKEKSASKKKFSYSTRERDFRMAGKQIIRLFNNHSMCHFIV